MQNLKQKLGQPFKLFESYKDEVRYIENLIIAEFESNETISILEAGCGQEWPLDISQLNFTLTGIDLDEDALNIRQRTQNDLDRVVIDDLKSVEFGDEKFDLIYNAFVLEYADGAEQVLDNFDSMLKPSGVMILKFPDRDTVFGFITRHSPFWFHVLYVKYIQGMKDAGKPGYAPYPTYYDDVVSRKGFLQYCEGRGYKVLAE